MLKREIKEKLREDNVFLTKVSAELGKSYSTVRSWVYRDSRKLTEIAFLQVVAKLLNKNVNELVK